MDQLGNGKVPSWDRLSKKGNAPTQRSGMSSVIHKGRMVCFGGVQDNEGDNHKMDSIFYDDLFTFDMTRRRWYKLEMKKASTKTRRRKKQVDDSKDESSSSSSDDDLSDDEQSLDMNNSHSGWTLDKIRSNMFAFIDGNGNIIYEKIDPEEHNDDDGYTADQDNSKSCEYDEKVNEPSDDESESFSENVEKMIPKVGGCINQMQTNIVTKSEVMHISEAGAPEAVLRETPLPRINAGAFLNICSFPIIFAHKSSTFNTVILGLFVERNNLFIYGGLLEVGDR